MEAKTHVNISGCLPPLNFTSLEKCEYVKENPECITDSLINYTRLYYCTENEYAHYAIFVVNLLLLLVYFMALSVAADSFFCPCLQVIVKQLNISQNIAGVTFLAFGNGAPDIFSAMASVMGSTTPKVGLAFGALAGAGVFLTTFVAALVILQKPFVSMRRPMLRDLVFFLLAVGLSISIIWNRKISVYEAAGFLGLYAIYCVSVVVGRYVRIRMLDRERKRESVTPTDRNIIPTVNSTASLATQVTPPDTPRSMSPNPVDHEPYMPSVEVISGAEVNRACSPVSSSDTSSSGSTSLRTTTVINTGRTLEVPDNEETRSQSPSWNVPEYNRHFQHHIHDDYSDDEFNEFDDDDVRMLGNGSHLLGYTHELMFALKPFSHSAWRNSVVLGRASLVCQSPIIVAYKLTIPVVDPEMRNMNWFKSLSLIHCVTCPMMLLFASGEITTLISGKVPVAVFVIATSWVAAAFLWYFTTRRVTPKYYSLVTYVGFIMSVIWIYTLAKEVVGVIVFIGAVARLSDAILGLTLVAWSNSLGDTISDVTMARQGYPRMAISACFGGPLLNLLVGIGLPFLYATIKNNEAIYIHGVQMSNGLLLLMAFLIFSLLSSLILIPLQRFNLGRPYAFFLIGLYIVFLVTNILYEFEVFSINLLH